MGGHAVCETTLRMYLSNVRSNKRQKERKSELTIHFYFLTIINFF